MIIVRTPLRISLGGGGTDLPSYYEAHGGFVLSAAIDKYVYTTVNRAFRPGYFLKYSKNEHVERREDIEHAIFRTAIELMDLETRTEIVTMADVPAGTGMGSSGSFTVSLLHALHAHKKMPVSPNELARLANHLEMNILGEPCGKQDHYIAAYGGLLCQAYGTGGSVEVAPLAIADDALRSLQEGLMLFFTGYSREASSLLAEQAERTSAGDAEMVDRLHQVKALGDHIRTALEAGDIDNFGALMHEHWETKRKRSGSMSSGAIDGLYALARENGALGGKLVGAGGGGFLLFFTRDRSRLRGAMADAGLQELPFTFDFDGSVTLLRN